MNNKQTQSDFELLDTIIDDNPHLNEKEILDLFQKSTNDHDKNKISIISDNISDYTELLLDAAISSNKPEDPQSQAKYEIGNKISTGGQSDVYLASRSDGTFNKTVIMKVLKHKFISKDDRTRFLNEIQILADLHHPNIVNIIDAGFNKNNEPWMVLEYIQGQHIDQHIIENKLSLMAIIRLVIDITESLLHIHKKNIHHLDIKPANIIIKLDNNTAHPYLIDFGVSSFHSNQEEIAINLATPAYASPEQLHEIRAPINHHSDIYAVGKLIISLTTNQSKHNKDLKSITDKCTKTYPEHRYKSIQPLLNDLKHFIAQEPVSTRKLTFNQKTIRKFKQKPVINGSLLLLLISVVALLFYSVTQSRTQSGLLKQQSKNSQYYWKIADEIKNTTRILYLRPSSNIQNELTELNTKFLHIEKQYQQESTPQQQAIALSLAKAAMSLGFYNKAQALLLFIHKTSPQDQDTNITLARNYLHLYQVEVQNASQFSNSTVRKSQIKILKQRYLEPVERLIKDQKITENNDNHLFNSMLLYFNGDINAALEQLNHSDTNELWPIPRMLFATAILTEEARKFNVSGQQLLANEWYKKAYKMSQKAHDIARSHPQILQQKCTLKASIILTEIQRSKHPVSEKIQDCETSIALLKGNEAATISTIYAYINLLRAQYILGQNPQYYLDIVDSMVQTSKELGNQQAQKNFILGQLYQIKGQWQMNTNQSSNKALNQSVVYHEKAAQLKPNHYMYQLEHANALFLFANSITPFNQVANDKFSLSTQIMQRLISHADATILLSSNLVVTLTNHSFFLYQNGMEADKHLNNALEIITQMEQKWPNNFKVQQAKSNLNWTFADYLVYQNKNPEPYLSQAIESYDLINKIQSRNWIKRYNQISAMLSGITYYLNNQHDQTTQLLLVDKKLTELNNIISNDIDLSSLYGHYYNMLAINTTLNKNNAQNTIIQSRKENAQCINSTIDGYVCLTQFATLVMIEHEYDFNHNRFDKIKWHNDLLILHNGIKKYPKHYQLLSDIALLRVLSTQVLQLNTKQTRIELLKAKSELETVFENQPLLKHRFNSDITHINHLLSLSSVSIN